MILRSLLTLVVLLAFFTEIQDPSTAFVRVEHEPIHRFTFAMHHGNTDQAPSKKDGGSADEYVVCSAVVPAVLLPEIPVVAVHVANPLTLEPALVSLEAFQRPPSRA
jgi:hypothetical protein